MSHRLARSDPRLAVEVALPLGFTALLAATAVIVAARAVLSAGDTLGLLVTVVAVVCWVGRPLAAAPVAVVDDLHAHGPADWWRLAVLAGGGCPRRTSPRTWTRPATEKGRGPRGRSDLRRADRRGVRAAGLGPAGGGAAVTAEDLVGLVVAVALTVFLVVALLFPERF